MMSSAMPSAKNSCSGSALILVSGNTATDGLSGRGSEEPTTWGTTREVTPPTRYALIGWGDVLRLLRAQIGKGQGQLRPDVVPNSTRDANATRLRESLQSSRDVNGVAEEVVSLHYDVADMDADPKPHLLIGRSINVLLGNGPLHRHSTLHGIHSTGEIGKDAITSRGEDPTAI